MTVKNRLITSAIGLTVTAILMTACQPKPPALTEKETHYMQTLTKKMTPRCVGRYLADVPEDMVLNSEGGQEIEGVTIDIKPMPESAFKLMLAGRKVELENTLLPGEKKFPALKTSTPLPGITQGLIFDRAESDASSSRMGRMLELLAWNAGYRILATIKATDTNFPEFDNDSWIKESKTTTPEKLAQLINVFNRIRGRADNEVPTTQGTCILNGFISGPPTDQEEVTIIYHFKTAEDVYFRFGTVSNYADDNTLLDRSKDIEGMLATSEGHTIRKGHRELKGVKGEEFLMAGRTEDRIMGHLFVYEGNSKIGSAQTPIVRVDFKNGTRKPMPERPYGADFPPPITKATLSEAEAVTLWDAVIPTIRPRPGAF